MHFNKLSVQFSVYSIMPILDASAKLYFVLESYKFSQKKIVIPLLIGSSYCYYRGLMDLEKGKLLFHKNRAKNTTSLCPNPLL